MRPPESVIQPAHTLALLHPAHYVSADKNNTNSKGTAVTGEVLKEGGGDESVAIGAVHVGVMMLVVVVLGRGIIIITGPPCQCRSGSGRGRRVKSHLVPKICPGLQTD